MSRNDAIKTILQREQDLGLWSVRLRGFPSWSVRRLQYYRLLKDGATTTAAEATRIPQTRRTEQVGWVEGARRLFHSFDRILSSREIWVLSSSIYRRRTEEGSYPCIFTQDLESQLGARLLFLELNDAKLPLPYAPDVVSLDATRRTLDVAARYAYKKIGPRLAGRNRSVFDFLPEAGQRSLILQSLIGTGMYEIGLTLMRMKRPKAIFVVDAYGRHIPFQLAARKLNIPIIEFQHGMIHESHPGYILPELDEALEKQLPFPDHLVVFGQHFGQVLDRESPRWRGRWSVGGHPSLRRLVVQAASEHTDPGHQHVVFFSQFESAVQEQVNRAAAEFARRVRGYRISIKPHPRERNADQIYRDAMAAGVELLSPSDNSYQLLQQTSVAVTVYSTLAVEALVFPCRSIVLKSPNWSEAVESLVAQGYLESAVDGEDLARVLAQEPQFRDRSEIAKRLFGIGEPDLDFEALIGQCCRQTASRP